MPLRIRLCVLLYLESNFPNQPSWLQYEVAFFTHFSMLARFQRRGELACMSRRSVRTWLPPRDGSSNLSLQRVPRHKSSGVTEGVHYSGPTLFFSFRLYFFETNEPKLTDYIEKEKPRSNIDLVLRKSEPKTYTKHTTQSTTPHTQCPS